LAAAHISRVNCDEMPEDRPRQNGCEFSALNANFSSPSIDPLGSRWPAHARVKKDTPLITGYFTDIASSSMKIVAECR